MTSQQTVLEYLTTTKIGEKGQVTVPKQFREDLGLDTGAPFAVLRLRNARPHPHAPAGPLRAPLRRDQLSSYCERNSAKGCLGYAARSAAAHL